MSSFQYQGRNAKGEAVSDVIEAANERAAVDLLINRGIMPTQIKAVAAKRSIDISQWFLAKVELDELILLCRQMYALSKAGIPMLRAISGLASSTPSKRLAQVLQQIGEGLANGRPLSVAMQEHPQVFTPLFISVIRVGENTGKLDDTFLQLANYFELELDTRKRIKAALRYPSFVLIAIGLAMVILNLVVIPKFVNMFSRFGVELPLPTRILIATSNAFVNYWPLMLVALIAVISGVWWYVHTDKGRLLWDKYKLRLPVVGSIIERSLLARFSRSFAMMLSAGVPLNAALSLVASAMDNAYMERAVREMRVGVERGESLLRVSTNTQLFTPLVLQMVAVGEETGRIDVLLQEAAEYYEREVDYDLKSLTAKIEPLLIGLVAIMVLILALGIFMPMWNMMDVFKGRA